jgi:hypothetical protein
VETGVQLKLFALFFRLYHNALGSSSETLLLIVGMKCKRGPVRA